jgi:hypothetical protein
MRKSAAARRRSAAAVKGWDTRRRNAEHAKRSAAARKGAETRRLNQIRAERSLRHAKRSAAARKGWETRRSRDAEGGGVGGGFVGADEREERTSIDSVDEPRETQGYGGRYDFDQDFGDYDDDSYLYDDLIGADEEEGS